MAIARVQAATVALGNQSSPQTLAFGVNVTAGNLLLLIVGLGLSSDVTGVTDTLGQTWTKAKSQVQTTDGGFVSLWYVENTAGGACTVQVAYASAANVRLIVMEYSGVATSGALNQTNSAQADASSAVNAGAINTTQPEELIVVAARNDTNTTFTAGAGYTLRTEQAAAPNTRLVYEDRVTSSSGSYSGLMTSSGNLLWAAVIVSFKGVGVASASRPPFRRNAPRFVSGRR